MHLSAFFGLLLPAAALAQYGPPSDEESSPTTTSAAPETTGSDSGVHIVQAGPGGDFEYVPDTVMAAVGEQVRFIFHPLNHTVVKGAFDTPCEPVTEDPIFSGYHPLAEGAEPETSFTINITDDRPIWIYCGQNILEHCQNGMAMVINPPSDGPNTLDAYKQAAAGTEISVVPPDVGGGVVAAVEDGDTPPPSGTESGGPSATPSGDVAATHMAALVFAAAPAALAMFL